MTYRYLEAGAFTLYQKDLLYNLNLYNLNKGGYYGDKGNIKPGNIFGMWWNMEPGYRNLYEK